MRKLGALAGHLKHLSGKEDSRYYYQQIIAKSSMKEIPACSVVREPENISIPKTFGNHLASQVCPLVRCPVQSSAATKDCKVTKRF